MNTKLINLSQKLGELLLKNKCFLATAESCTGGLLASAITSIPGSSQWFERGFITYSNEAKEEMLGVKRISLNQFGAVSESVVKEMAEGACSHSHAQLSMAITGIAGPDGGSLEKPIGTVWFGFRNLDGKTQTSHQCFTGSRQAIQEAAAVFALQYMIDHL
jgi:nicotinamide-nucleotide amidase